MEVSRYRSCVFRMPWAHVSSSISVFLVVTRDCFGIDLEKVEAYYAVELKLVIDLWFYMIFSRRGRGRIGSGTCCGVGRWRGCTLQTCRVGIDVRGVHEGLIKVRPIAILAWILLQESAEPRAI